LSGSFASALFALLHNLHGHLRSCLTPWGTSAVIIPFQPIYSLVNHCGHNIRSYGAYQHVVPYTTFSLFCPFPEYSSPTCHNIAGYYCSTTCISHPNPPLFGSLLCSPSHAKCCNHSLISYFLHPCSFRAQPRKCTYKLQNPPNRLAHSLSAHQIWFKYLL